MGILSGVERRVGDNSLEGRGRDVEGATWLERLHGGYKDVCDRPREASKLLLYYYSFLYLSLLSLFVLFIFFLLAVLSSIGCKDIS